MNIRQQLYKKYRLEGMTKYAAARKAGYSHNTAHNATRNIDKRCSFNQLAEIKGITDNYLADYIIERLNAQKVIAADIMVHSENGQLKVNKNSNDWVEVPDYQAQHKFLMTLLMLIDKIKIPNQAQITNIINNKIGTNGKLTAEDRDLQQRMLARLKDKYFTES